jgi:carbonic anhydrase
MRKDPTRTLTLFGAAVALASLAAPAAAQHTSGAHWEYEGAHGPGHWGALDRSYEKCSAGKQQSPIDIRDAKSADLPAITFSYRPTPLKLIDNGHTVQVTYAPGSFITVGNQRYELQQFHFHHPSEERVSGKSYPMVAHLVHKNSAGQLAVVAVLLSKGAANSLVEKLWRYLPVAPGKEVNPQSETIDATDLLPSARGYYTFTGSLTTPPCSEGVTWFVLKAPTQVSGGEVLTFARRYPHNARPVQPLDGRVIEQSQ